MAYDRSLHCTPIGLSYLCERSEGLFFHEPNEAADMLALVKMFQKLDPEVQVISTFAGATADTIYVKHPVEGWCAYEPSRNGKEPQPKTPMVRH